MAVYAPLIHKAGRTQERAAGDSVSLTSAEITTALTYTPLQSPLTTRGDLLTQNPSGTHTRLAIGSVGKFLRTDGTDPSWQLLVAGDIPALDTSKLTTGTMATARLGSGTANSTTFLRGDQTYAAPTAVLADGDYTDITVSGSGTALTIDPNVVTYAKMQDVSATSRILGRVTSGAGDVEELTGAQVLTIAGAAPAPSTQTLTDGANIAWNVSLGTFATVTLGGNRIMNAPTNLVAGASYGMKIIQDATPPRTLTWNAVFKWAGGIAPVLSSGSGAVDIVSFVSDGTNLYGSALRGFA